ncbi:MAG: YfcE family phosphodiesterase [Erysipelotrichaceae bacterium]|nr:YfcE family phosphodiesterase [Erysipelotrichaceae bacterium]
MKILVISDSHRYYTKLKDVINRYQDEVDMIIHCGDSEVLESDPVMQPFVRRGGIVLDEGDRKYDLMEVFHHEVVGYDDRQLSSPLCIGIRGNCDYGNYPIVSIYKNILVTHGHMQFVKGTPFQEGTLDQLVALAKQYQCTMVFYGHTHIPYKVEKEGITIINPGSLGRVPRMEIGTYAIVEEDVVHFYDAEVHERFDEVAQMGNNLLDYFGYGR